MADFSAFADEPYDPYNRPNDQPTGPGVGAPIVPVPPPGNVVTTTGGPQTLPPIEPPTRGGGGGGGVSAGLGGGDHGPQFDFSAFPRFNPVNRQFTPLSLQQARDEPGYAFAEQQGQQGIERSAAAKGVLRTGGTLKDIGSWVSDFAARNYGDANQRELQRFLTNYQVEKDQFAPILSEAQLRANAEIQRARDVYARGTAWNAPRSGGGGGGSSVLSYEEWKRENGY